jgi:hypothetical protein
MRILGNSLILCVLLLTGCGTMAPGGTRLQTEANANQFVGSNIQTVINQWGTADQAMHTREGSSYYVYLTKSDKIQSAMSSNYDPQLTGRRGEAFAVPTTQNIYGDNGLRCTTTFKTNPAGTIIWAKHQGSNCAGTWVNTAEK